MNHTLRTTIKKAIGQISGFAHMNLEETKDFIRVYLEGQIKKMDGKNMNDQNMEDVFSTIAQEQKMSVEELKKEIYEILSKQNMRSVKV